MLCRAQYLPVALALHNSSNRSCFTVSAKLFVLLAMSWQNTPNCFPICITSHSITTTVPTLTGRRNVTVNVRETPPKAQKSTREIGATAIVVHMSNIRDAAPPCKLPIRLHRGRAIISSKVTVAVGVDVAFMNRRCWRMSAESKPYRNISVFP